MEKQYKKGEMEIKYFEDVRVYLEGRLVAIERELENDAINYQHWLSVKCWITTEIREIDNTIERIKRDCNEWPF